MSRAGSVAVKRRDGSSAPRTSTRNVALDGRRRGWTRHLDGWEPGLVAVVLAGSAAILAVPRPVEPAELPLPIADVRALTRARDADLARAREAEQLGLDTDVRELGSAFRAFGAVDADPDHDPSELLAVRKRLVAAVGPALAQGDEALLRLRAYQQRSFIREVRRFEATGEVTDELRELAGDFVGLLRQNAWIEERGVERRVAMNETVLSALFKKRWSAVVGLQRSPFDLTLDEERALLGFLLSRPAIAARGAEERGSPTSRPPAPRQAGAPGARPPAAAMLAVEARRAEERYRLRKIDELAALDPTYPKHLARGVVFYRLGEYLQAVEAFRSHLDEHPDGPHTLRARNYLRAALGRVVDEPL